MSFTLYKMYLRTGASEYPFVELDIILILIILMDLVGAAVTFPKGTQQASEDDLQEPFEL